MAYWPTLWSDTPLNGKHTILSGYNHVGVGYNVKDRVQTVELSFWSRDSYAASVMHPLLFPTSVLYPQIVL